MICQFEIITGILKPTTVDGLLREICMKYHIELKKISYFGEGRNTLAKITMDGNKPNIQNFFGNMNYIFEQIKLAIIAENQKGKKLLYLPASMRGN